MVGKRHALGLAGRPGGVNQRGHVLGLDGVRERVKDRVPFSSALIGPGQHFSESDRPLGCRGVHDQYPSELRQAADGVQLVELLPGGNHGNAAARIRHQRGDLLAGQRGVDGHIHSADGQRGKVCDGPLPAILGNQGDAVALLHAPAEKCLSQCTDPLVKLV